MTSAFGNDWNVQAAIISGGISSRIVVIGAEKGCRVGGANGCQENGEDD